MPTRQERLGWSFRTLVARRRKQPRKGGRSDLFWWMVLHHDELHAEIAANGGRADWATWVEDFQAAGLTSRGAEALRVETARTTWKRAKAFVAKDHAAAAREAAAVADVPVPEPQASDPARIGTPVVALPRLAVASAGRPPPAYPNGSRLRIEDQRNAEDRPAPVRRLKRASLGSVSGEAARPGEGTPPGVRQLHVIKKQGSDEHGDEEGRGGGG